MLNDIKGVCGCRLPHLTLKLELLTSLSALFFVSLDPQFPDFKLKSKMGLTILCFHFHLEAGKANFKPSTIPRTSAKRGEGIVNRKGEQRFSPFIFLRALIHEVSTMRLLHFLATHSLRQGAIIQAQQARPQLVTQAGSTPPASPLLTL